MVSRPLSWLSPAKLERLGIIPSANLLWLHNDGKVILVSISHFTILREVKLDSSALGVFSCPDDSQAPPGIFVLYGGKVVRLSVPSLEPGPALAIPKKLGECDATSRVIYDDGFFTKLSIEEDRFSIHHQDQDQAWYYSRPLNKLARARRQVPYCFNFKHAFVVDKGNNVACLSLSEGSKLCQFGISKHTPVVNMRCQLENNVLAVALNHGAVMVLNFQMDTQQVMTVFSTRLHWHSMAITSFVWSWDGQTLYTGGNEQALVQWDWMHSTKMVVPRLGGTLNEILVDKRDGSLYLFNDRQTLLSLNSSLFLEPKVLTISSLTKFNEGDCFWHAPTSTVMTMEKNQALSFYSLSQSGVAWTMHMNKRNESVMPNQKQPNPSCLSLSPSGRWLVYSLGEVLELWNFQDSEKTFKQTASLFQTHDSTVKHAVVTDSPIFLTADSIQVKLWQYLPEAKKASMIGQITFKNKKPTQLAISGDETVVGAAFNESVTLWDRENLALICVLTTDLSLKHLFFTESYLVGIANGKQIQVWSLQNLNHSETHNIVGKEKKTPNTLRNMPRMFLKEGTTLMRLDEVDWKLKHYRGGVKSKSKAGEDHVASEGKPSSIGSSLVKPLTKTDPTISTTVDHECSLQTCLTFSPVSSTMIQCLEECL
ncbi:hypothetical protein TCAL_04207 [Tigriopus californicus]|uniref:Uncharacterized protein n=1 Tax=Tigriopus californicus TaxID=6832 RepID=A0A553N9P4_TIGCA|nr:uncharacterized protein LOC131884615 [Tigriopus californicus]TRY62119.1 hypothetical protein TCAL_04207 [Tigriopus californicus]|eukprot:TCALIF_04207-PA protein Name:"Similar to wdr75 WD repeat-containing protein 75 (Danio rerio)" AED:0.33 eAED:0.33 QI:101/1/1/1/1/1/2/70/651